MTPSEIRIAISALPAKLCAALTVYAEAAGEGEAGQLGVLWVLKNRAARWRMSIQAVCLQPNQFSCWWGADMNSARLFRMAETVLTGGTPSEPGWSGVLVLTDLVLRGALPNDPTHGATFYCADYVLADPARRDEWFPKAVRSKKLIETTRIGGHVFFSEAMK